MAQSRPYEYILYSTGFVGDGYYAGIFVFRGDLGDPNPANAHIINVTQRSTTLLGNYVGDADIERDIREPIMNPSLQYTIRTGGTGGSPFRVFKKIGLTSPPSSFGIDATLIVKDNDEYWPGDELNGTTVSFPSNLANRDAVYHPIDRRIFYGDGGTSGNLVWNLNETTGIFTPDENWPSLLPGIPSEVPNASRGLWISLSRRAMLVTEDQKYVIISRDNGVGGGMYIYERPGPFVTYQDVPENDYVRLTNPAGMPGRVGPVFHDPFNNELHYTIETGNGSSTIIALDTMTVLPGITNTNPGFVSISGNVNTIYQATSTELSDMYFADDLCIATWDTDDGSSTHLFRRISGEWILQPYPFTENPQSDTPSDRVAIIVWPLDKRYVLIGNNSGSPENKYYYNWYKRNGYTYEYVGPLVVGGDPEIYESPPGVYKFLPNKTWVNNTYVYTYYGATIVPPWSSTTKAIMDLLPLYHLSPEDGDYSEAVFDIGTARVKPDGSPVTYNRNSANKRIDISNPSLGVAFVSTGSLETTPINVYYRAHAFSETSSSVAGTSTFPALAAQTSGTVVLLFKTSSDFSGYTNTGANLLNAIYRIIASTPARRLFFGFNVASGVVKFGVLYQASTSSTPSSGFVRKRVCDTTPLAVDTWYLVTVYQPGDGTDLDITINGVTQSYTTTGTANVNGWIADVTPLANTSATIGFGGATNFSPLTRFSISDAAIFNRELTAGEISNTSNVVATAAASDTRYPTIWKSMTFAQSPDDATQYGYGSTSRNGGGTAFGTLTNTTYRSGNTVHYFTNKSVSDPSNTSFNDNLYTFRLEISGVVPKEDFLYLDYLWSTGVYRYKLYSKDASYTAGSEGSNNVWIWTKRLPSSTRRRTTGETTLRFVF